MNKQLLDVFSDVLKTGGTEVLRDPLKFRAYVKDVNEGRILWIDQYLQMCDSRFLSFFYESRRDYVGSSIDLAAKRAVEYLVNNHYLVHTDGNDIRLDKHGKGVQPSIGAGVGVELRLAPNFGLFFDPSIRYYFDTKQPRSIRTIQPLRMDLEAGVRFTL